MKRWLLPLAVLACTWFSACEVDSNIACLEGCDYEYDASEYGNSTKPGDYSDDTSGNINHNGGNSDVDEFGNPINPGGSTDGSGDEPDVDACGNTCDIGEICMDGTCVIHCLDGEIACNGSCVRPEALNMLDCTTCMADYCDADDDLNNGCEVYVLDNDNQNCGACGRVCDDDQSCSHGVCNDLCPAGETLCGDQCLNLNDLHLSSCSACKENYCDADGNMQNGCEIFALGDDTNHCGGCGMACVEGQFCANGACETPYDTHRVMILVGNDTLNVRSGNSTSYAIVGTLSTYQYVTVLEEKDGWYRIQYNGQEAWISASYTMDAGEAYAGRAAIDVAEKFLYTDHPGYCTYDFLSHEPKITNFTDLSGYGSTYNYGYNDNCANFVTSSLKTAGLIAKNILGVGKLYNYCKDGTEGYRFTTLEDAKAGDIWINESKGHTELVVGYNKGNVILIGSNNFSSSASLSGLCVKTYYTNSKYSSKPSSYQRVSYASTTKGYICTRRSP